MVTAVELDDTGAAGRGAGEANRGHAGLGPGADQAHLARHRDGGGDPLGDRHFELGGSAVTEAEGGLLGDGGDDLGMGMAEDRGTIGSDVVDEAIAVGVDHHRAFAAGDEERRAADRLPCADRRVNGARDDGGSAGEECGGIFLFDHLRVLLSLCSLTFTAVPVKRA